MDIFPRSRSGFYILEKCRIMMKDNRVCYVTENKNSFKFISIPIENTSFIILTMGCSISTSAARELSSCGIVLMFAGTGGTPVFMTAQEEYRPSEYMQNWVKIYLDEQRRFTVAKKLQEYRVQNILNNYHKKEELKNIVFVDDLCAEYLHDVTNAKDTNFLLAFEAKFTKGLYGRLAKSFKINNFTRNHGAKDSSDATNSFLDYGNYLAYGMASAALYSLGISYAFPVMHGKTRRGALVFDVADIVKDAFVMPTAFLSASQGESDSEFRNNCIKELEKNNVLKMLFTIVKEISEKE